MKRAHFICRGRQGIFRVSEGHKARYTSSAWDVSESDAKALVRGMIYFHEAKSETSYFGGEVTGYRLSEEKTENGRSRVIFELNSMPEGRGIRWDGKHHSMAHYSGIISDES